MSLAGTHGLREDPMKTKNTHGPESSTRSKRLLTRVKRKPARLRHQKGSTEEMYDELTLLPDAQQQEAKVHGLKSAARFSRTAALGRGRRRTA